MERKIIILKKMCLVFNTVRHLKPIQIYGQVRNHYKKLTRKNKNIKNNNKEIISHIDTIIYELDTEQHYINRFKPDFILKGQFTFLNETKYVDLTLWKVPCATHLWNYNLHYFEFGIALAAMYKRTKKTKYYFCFKNIVENWLKYNSTTMGDAWKPYTISLRIPNLMISLQLFGDIFEKDLEFKKIIFNNIYTQYQYLFKNMEIHILGNHYFENLKALLLCTLLFEEQKAFNIVFNKLLKEIKEQILPDGMHFERSVMYHKLILEDILRITFWLKQKNISFARKFTPFIQKMLDCVFSLDRKSTRL